MERGTKTVKIALEKVKITKTKRCLKTKWAEVHIIVIAPQTDSKIQGTI